MHRNSAHVQQAARTTRTTHAARTARVISRSTLIVDGLNVQVTRKTMKSMVLRVRPLPNSTEQAPIPAQHSSAEHSINNEMHFQIEVSAPARASDEAIISFVRSRKPWIERQLERLRETSEQPSSNAASPNFEWTDERLTQARANLTAQLPDLLRRWEPVVGRAPSHITLRLMRSRWGSCTPATGRIRLSLQLGLMDPKFLEYVLVHELTHLWERGHGEAFQHRMDSYLPNWRKLRAELNREGR